MPWSLGLSGRSVRDLITLDGDVTDYAECWYVVFTRFHGKSRPMLNRRQPRLAERIVLPLEMKHGSSGLMEEDDRIHILE